MTVAQLKAQGLLLLEAVRGSHAYGTALPESDVDIQGVFFLPPEKLYGLDYLAQIAEDNNNVVFYELGRFVELLANSNPSVLELLNTPKDCLRFRHPLMDHIRTKDVLSKRCEGAFAGYAHSQIKKARGLNKKMLNPMSEARKPLLDFCWVTAGQGAMPLPKWLSQHQRQQQHCGLVNIAHMKGLFALFYDEQAGYSGIIRKPNAEQVCLSSVLKGALPVAYLYFNQDGYSSYCREHKEYWQWVTERNEVRYQNTLAHGQRYDSKNMMHTFRLLDMAYDIATQQQVVVRRPNREALLQIRAGVFDYETLLNRAEAKVEQVKTAFEASRLPEQPNCNALNRALVRMRQELYAA